MYVLVLSFPEIRDLHVQRRELHDEFRQHQLLYMETMKAAATASVTQLETTDQHGHREVRKIVPYCGRWIGIKRFVKFLLRHVHIM